MHTHAASLGAALMRAVTFRKCQAACQTDKQCQSLSSTGSSHPRTMENTQYTREAGWGRWHTHTHTQKPRLESYYSIFNGSKTTLPSNARCPRWETESVMRLSVSVVISSPRWWRCVACLGSCVCLLFAGGVSFFTCLCFFYDDAVNVERSNGSSEQAT